MRIEYFQLIDRITELNVTDLTISAEATVPETSTIFEGHFPGYPLMPGVLLIEAMAQASGWLIIARTRFESMPFLASIKEAKLRTFVRPAQMLTIRSKIVHEGSGFAVAEAATWVGDKPVCDATITFRLMTFGNEGFRAEMEKTAARIGLSHEATLDG